MSVAVAAHGQIRARLTDAIPLALLLINTMQCSFISLYLVHITIYMYIRAGVHGTDSARLSLVTLLHPLTHALCVPLSSSAAHGKSNSSGAATKGCSLCVIRSFRSSCPFTLARLQLTTIQYSHAAPRFP